MMKVNDIIEEHAKSSCSFNKRSEKFHRKFENLSIFFQIEFTMPDIEGGGLHVAIGVMLL